MTKINIYDTEAEIINEISDKYDASEAAIIRALLEIIEYNDIDIEEYL